MKDEQEQTSLDSSFILPNVRLHCRLTIGLPEVACMETFQRLADQYGYLALFVGVLLENAGLPVPGETAVLVSGFLASPAGGAHFRLLSVILITLVAAVLGDNIGFW